MFAFLLIAALADELRVPTWSSEFDAVLVTGADAATVLLADASTSAPVTAGRVQVRLVPDAGDPIQVESQPDGRGAWTLPAPLSPGHWTGTITVLTDARADALGLPETHVGDLTAAVAIPPGGVPWTVAVALAVAGLAVGVGVGRRRTVLAASVGALAVAGLTPRDSAAHGGEVHDGLTPVGDVSGDLVLELDRQFLIGLRTERAVTDTLAARARASGYTLPAPGGRAVVRAIVPGTLRLAITVRPGAHVRRGDVLGTVDEQLDATGRLGLGAAVADAYLRVDEARAALTLAEQDTRAADALGDVVSGRERLERDQRLQVARRALTEAERAAASVDLPTVIVAPFDGVIASLPARPGDAVDAGDVVLTLTAPGALWAEVRLPELWAGRIVPGADARLRMDARPDVWLRAAVLDAGQEADPATGTLRTTLQLDGAPLDVVSGMAVTAELAVGTSAPAVVVPEAAVVHAAGVPTVFVKMAPERFEARPVQLGPHDAGRRVVHAGLADGDRVVVDGEWALRALAGR